MAMRQTGSAADSSKTRVNALMFIKDARKRADVHQRRVNALMFIKDA
jgi:hypothetical protein